MNYSSAFPCYAWESDIFNCQSNDIDTFYALLAKEVVRLGLNETTLGDTGDFPVSFYQSPAQQTGLPSLLISAGFHGEEAAGPWGMLHFLRSITAELLKKVNLSLLPLVNPVGFSRGNRLNDQGENPNRGFIPENNLSESDEQPSAEGRLLLANSALLQAASRDGILTCHEDVLLDDTYIYSFENREEFGAFSVEMRDTLGHYFPIAVDGEIDDCPIANGVIFNHFDYSFEAYLVRSGAKVGVCSETPGQQNFDQRILANSAIISTFIRLSRKSGGS